MNFTSYDTVWSMFLQNCKTDDIELPQTNQGKYDMIRNSILYFNNRMEDSLKTDDLTETVNRELSDDHLLILANFLRLAFLKNQLTYFITVYQPFQKEKKKKNFSYQLSALKTIVEDEVNTIDAIILHQSEDFI